MVSLSKSAVTTNPGEEIDTTAAFELQDPRGSGNLGISTGYQLPHHTQTPVDQSSQNDMQISDRTGKSVERQGSNLPAGLWIIPCYKVSRYGTRAKHVDVSKGTFDAELFTRFRELYFQQRTWKSKFLEMKEVSAIKFINVRSPAAYPISHLRSQS
jgi:hypothetical protein